MAVNIHITIIELNALHTKRQNLFQELDAVIHLLMEAKHWGLRKSRNATSLNSRDRKSGSAGKECIAGDSFEMDAVGALRLSPLRRGLAIDSTVDIFTFYVPHRHVYGEQWIKFMKDGVNASPLPTVNTSGYIAHAAFLGTISPDTNKIPKHLFQGYL